MSVLRQAAVAHFVEHGRHELHRPWRIASSASCSIALNIDMMSEHHTAKASLDSRLQVDRRSQIEHRHQRPSAPPARR